MAVAAPADGILRNIAFWREAARDAVIFRVRRGNMQACAGQLADKRLIGAKLPHLQKKARPEVLNLPENLDAYDEIYLGYPNYWGTMPMAVYTFLERYDFTGKTIHPFCTHEGSGLAGTVQDIRKAAPGAAMSRS